MLGLIPAVPDAGLPAVVRWVTRVYPTLSLNIAGTEAAYWLGCPSKLLAGVSMRLAPAAQPSTFRSHLDSLRIPYGAAAYRAGTVIYRQADPCDSVLHVQTGRVRLSVIDRCGKEGVIALARPGGFLGEEALAGVPARRETATAITDTEVLVVAKADLLNLLHTDRLASEQFLAHLLLRRASLETSLGDQLLRSSEQRVARCLLDLADCNCRPGRICVLPPVSQSVIAEMVGTTRSHVNTFMAKFRRLGLIQQRAGELLVRPSLLTVVDGNAIHDAK